MCIYFLPAFTITFILFFSFIFIIFVRFYGISTDIADVDGIIEKRQVSILDVTVGLVGTFCRFLACPYMSLYAAYNTDKPTHTHTRSFWYTTISKYNIFLFFVTSFRLGNIFQLVFLSCAALRQINMHVKAFCCRLCGINVILFLYSRICYTTFSDFLPNL